MAVFLVAATLLCIHIHVIKKPFKGVAILTAGFVLILNYVRYVVEMGASI